MHNNKELDKVSKKVKQFRSDVTVYKRIGKGRNGTVYLIKHNGVKKVLKHQLLKNTKDVKSGLAHEMEFYKWISQLHNASKIFFIQEYKTIIEEPNKNEILIESILEYKKGFTLTTITKRLSKYKIDIIRNIFMQILYIINFIQSSKWYHNDLHGGNIICRPIKNRMKLNLYLGAINKHVPFNVEAYNVSAIDYGETIHIKHLKDDHVNLERILFNIIFDIERIFIVNLLGLQLDKAKLPFNVLTRLKKFKKKHKNIYKLLYKFIKVSYSDMLHKRAKHILGPLYNDFNIEGFIKKNINKSLASVSKPNSIMIKTSWILYLLELIIIIKYESQYLDSLHVKTKIVPIVNRITLLNILLSPTEYDQSIILQELCEEYFAKK
jgi:hypothetical protein